MNAESCVFTYSNIKVAVSLQINKQKSKLGAKFIATLHIVTVIENNYGVHTL